MKPWQLTRRHFLRSAAAALSGACAFGGVERLAPLGGPWAFAEEGARDDRYYVFAYFRGGWDILLSLDPRDPRDFGIDRVAATRIMPGYDLLDGGPRDILRAADGTPFGPYMGDLIHHWDKMAVVRGMSMNTLTHEVGMRYFLTGRPPAGLQARGSSAPTVLAGEFGEDHDVPNLAVRVESYNQDRPDHASALIVDGVPSLLDTLRARDPSVSNEELDAINRLLASHAECDAVEMSRFVQSSEMARQRSQLVLESNIDRRFDFQARSEDMDAVRDHYGIAANGTTALTTPAAQAALAATALKTGLSRCVSIEMARSLDTHFDNWATDQGPQQEAGFNALARLVEDLASSEYKDTGSSWLDHTVIVGFSEFSRTPMINAAEGRDHSLTNACFVMGGPVRGGRVIGASSDVGMTPLRMNLTTGQLDPEGTYVSPEHVLRALYVEAGIEDDIADLRVDPLLSLFG